MAFFTAVPYSDASPDNGPIKPNFASLTLVDELSPAPPHATNILATDKVATTFWFLKNYSS